MHTSTGVTGVATIQIKLLFLSSVSGVAKNDDTQGGITLLLLNVDYGCYLASSITSHCKVLKLGNIGSTLVGPGA